jgi:hypothetical protein
VIQSNLKESLHGIFKLFLKRFTGFLGGIGRRFCGAAFFMRE